MRLWWEWFLGHLWSQTDGQHGFVRVGLANRATCVDRRPHCVHWTLGGLFMLYEHGSIIRWCAGICWDLAFGCMMTVGSVCDLKLCLTMQGLLTWDFSEWVVPLFKYMINNAIPRMTVYNPFVGLFSGCLCDLGCSSSCGFGSAEWPQRLDRWFSSDFKKLKNFPMASRELRSWGA